MKKLLYFMSVIFVLITASQNISALTNFGYAWYAMDNYGQYLPNRTDLTIRVTILEGETTRYKELHSVISSDQFAIFILVVGSGVPVFPYTPTNFSSITYNASMRLRAEVSTDGVNFVIVTVGDLASLPKDPFPLDSADLPDGLVYDDDNPATGDISGTFGTGFQIVNGVVTNAEIADATQFVDVQDVAGTNQFYVTDGNKALSFEGTGEASVAFNPTNHKVTINVNAPTLPEDISGEPFVVWSAPTGLSNAKMIMSGTAINSVISASDISLNVLFDGLTIGTNGSNQLYVLDNAVTSSKIANGTIKPEDLDLTGGPFGISISGNAATASKLNNALSTGAGLTGGPYDGSLPVTISVVTGGITTNMLADGAVTNAKVTSIDYSKITNAPAGLPPTGAAGGDLSGTYPNPQIATNAVTTAEIANGTIQPEDLNLTGGTFGISISGNASTATTAAKVANKLTEGFGILDFEFDGSAPATVAVDQTANYNWTGTNTFTNSTTFNGTINATTITGNLTGNATTATTADKVANPLTQGDGISTFSFDGSTAGVTVGIANKGVTPAKILDGNSNQVLVTNAAGTDAVWSSDLNVNSLTATTVNVSNLTATNITGNVTGNATTATTANKVANKLTEGFGILDFEFDGSAPATVAVDQTANYNWTGTNTFTSSTTFNGNINATTITGNLTGNATTATTADKVANPLTQGDGISAFSFDGSTAGITVGIADNGVTSAKITSGAVGTSQINDATIFANIGNGTNTMFSVTDGNNQLNFTTSGTLLPTLTFNAATNTIDFKIDAQIIPSVPDLSAEPYITFSTPSAQLTNAKVLNAGLALNLSNTTEAVLDVNVDNVTIEVNTADALQIKDNGVTSAKIANGTITNDDVSAVAGIGVSKLGATTLENDKILTVIAGVPTWSDPSAVGTAANVANALTVGTALEFTDTPASFDGSAPKTIRVAAGSINSSLIANNTIQPEDVNLSQSGWAFTGTDSRVSNLNGGSSSQVPYQTSANTTAFSNSGSNGNIFWKNETSGTPEWTSASSLTISPKFTYDLEVVGPGSYTIASGIGIYHLRATSAGTYDINLPAGSNGNLIWVRFEKSSAGGRVRVYDNQIELINETNKNVHMIFLYTDGEWVKWSIELAP